MSTLAQAGVIQVVERPSDLPCMSILAAVLDEENAEGVLFRESTTMERGLFSTATGVVTITRSHLHFDPELGTGRIGLYGANFVVLMVFNAVTFGWAARRSMFRRPTFYVQADLATIELVQIRRRRVRVVIGDKEHRFVLSGRREFQRILEGQSALVRAT